MCLLVKYGGRVHARVHVQGHAEVYAVVTRQVQQNVQRSGSSQKPNPKAFYHTLLSPHTQPRVTHNLRSTLSYYMHTCRAHPVTWHVQAPQCRSLVMMLLVTFTTCYQAHAPTSSPASWARAQTQLPMVQSQYRCHQV
jgi:hypothetical protein